MESLKPDTTSEENLHTKAKRTIDFIWEFTQALIAIAIVLANILAAFKPTASNAILDNAFFLVIGFYFSRTNHLRLGGKGKEAV